MNRHSQQNLAPERMEELRLKALELGADRAAIISTSDIAVSEAVSFKCRVPRCPNYDTCANCPPHSPTPEEFRKVLASFSQALLFNQRFPPEVMVSPDKSAERREAFASIFKLAADLESAAFYAGHYLAFGLPAGSCKSVFCHAHEHCAVLDGQPCLFPALARPSMEAVGIDVFQVAALAGWDLHPVGRGADPEAVADSSLTGLVVVS